ncbi:hypothetical protein C1645_829124 [Glomus cerebriforme]|uniref:Uncharacterized protein n=1 Tax=Glomus cerebriforme TaxID=658196 RepID=A0A397SK76_9GLOM|nr:hypothetical protein C1645_829124 [Glomus cerebriforme]
MQLPQPRRNQPVETDQQKGYGLTVQGFYEKNIKKKDGYISTLDDIGLWLDSKLSVNNNASSANNNASSEKEPPYYGSGAGNQQQPSQQPNGPLQQIPQRLPPLQDLTNQQIYSALQFIFAELQRLRTEVQGLRTEVLIAFRATNIATVHRSYNAHIFNDAQRICKIPNIQNLYPDDFPNNVRELRALDDGRIDTLLQFYDLPTTGTLVSKHQRFGLYIGLRLL